MISEIQDLLHKRYGSDAPQVPDQVLTDLSVVRTLLAHKSVRRFQPRPLPPGTLDLIGASAQSAASSSNLQAWSVIALQDPEHKAQAAKLCGDQDFIRKAPLFLVFCADLARLTAVSAQEGLPGDGLAYTELFLVATIDAALAAQNAAACAEGLGLGICYVGAARNHPQELADLLKLPQRVIALFGMAIGIPSEDDTTQIKPRLPQSGLIHHETYSETDRDQAVQDYNETMAGFYNDQSMKVEGTWGRHSAKRVAGLESLSGRHILRQILEDRGFELK